jgi:hypothetical protein
MSVMEKQKENGRKAQSWRGQERAQKMSGFVQLSLAIHENILCMNPKAPRPVLECKDRRVCSEYQIVRTLKIILGSIKNCR